jgi:AbrB family looped-hinge helix DNA binding protein
MEDTEIPTIRIAGVSRVQTVANVESSRIGKRGTVVIPARLRKQFGLEEGAFVIAEGRPDGILLRPAELLPVEAYSAERKAEFLLGKQRRRRSTRPPSPKSGRWGSTRSVSPTSSRRGLDRIPSW